MSSYLIIYIISCIVWMLPPFKQKRTDYFLFFLVLAIADPLGLALTYLLHVKSSFYTLGVIMAAISVLFKGRNLVIGLSSGILILLFVQIFSISLNDQDKLVSFFMLLMIILLVVRFMSYLNKREINLFLTLLIFYFSINLFRMLALASLDQFRELTFIMGYTFQILFGILFIFINVNTKNYKLNIR